VRGSVVTPSLFGLLEGHARTRPNAPFLTYANGDDEGRVWSYEDAVGAAGRVVAGLREAGVAPGDRFVVCLENRPFMVTALLAASASGTIAVYADPRLTDHELDHVFTLSGARVAFGGEGNSALATATTRAMARLALVDDSIDGGLGRSEAAVMPVADRRDRAAPELADDVVELLFTSGSTSRPKGVMLTNRSLHYGGGAMAHGAGYTPLDVPLLALPFSHAAAQIHQLIPTLILGGHAVLVDRFSATRFFAQAARHGATTSALFAAALRMLLGRGVAADARAARLRHVTFAQNLTKDEYAGWAATFGVPLQQLWGMTEICGLPLMSPLEGDRRLAAMGRPVPEYEVAIRAPDGTPVAFGVEGELTVRADPGVDVALGYYGDPAATVALIRDGWLWTSDVVRADDDGFVHFVGRSKEIIRRAGMNFSSIEIEEVIRSVAGVIDVAVVGLPDAMRDERVAAFVVRAGSEPTLEDVLDACRRMLAGYKRPDHVEFVAELPRTAVGKIQKHLLVPTIGMEEAMTGDAH
jgi:crotonobetaine/carnitine-CoA ligase